MHLIKAIDGAISHPSLFLHVLQGRSKFNREFERAMFQECLNRAKVLRMEVKSDDLVELCNRILEDRDASRMARNYVLCSQLKPEIAVETGVGHGYSSGF